MSLTYNDDASNAMRAERVVPPAVLYVMATRDTGAERQGWETGSPEVVGEVIADMIADLAHLADIYNVDGRVVITNAIEHYESERNGR